MAAAGSASSPPEEPVQAARPESHKRGQAAQHGGGVESGEEGQAVGEKEAEVAVSGSGDREWVFRMRRMYVMMI